MFGSDDHKQDNNDGVDQAAAAAASDHATFDSNQTPAPSGDTPLPTTSDGSTTDTTAPAVVAPSAGNDDLLSIKQEALKQLSPLVGHLDQTPEEKFRTTMMMIQASDDQSMVKAAYDAAQAITDVKTRAQALLDIINEINYFTQNHAS